MLHRALIVVDKCDPAAPPTRPKDEATISESKVPRAVTTWLAATLMACGDPQGGASQSSLGGIASEAILPSESAGSLKGSLKVGDDGSANYTIPLEVPAGRAGVAPELALTYNSRGGNGLIGVGWSLSGLSAIRRCPKTIAQDGEPRPVRLDSTDALCIDGKRLVSVGASTYRTVPDTFMRIDVTAYDANGDPLSFTVYTRDGRILTYGGSNQSRLAVNPATYNSSGALISYASRRHVGWLLSEVADRSGNSYTLTYGQQILNATTHTIEYWLRQIDYVKVGIAFTRTVAFEYANNRPDPVELWQNGTLTRTRRLLTRIAMYAPAADKAPQSLVRSYRVDYETSPTTKRSRVTRMRLCDGGAVEVCLPPTTFAYPPDYEGDIGPAFEQKAYAGFDVFDLTGGLIALHIADVNGDGRDDVVYRQRGGQWYARFGQDDGLGPAVPQTGLPVEPLVPNLYSRTQDMDGDGRVDLILETLKGDIDGIHEWQAAIYRATPTDHDDRSLAVQLVPTFETLPIGDGPNGPPPPNGEYKPARHLDRGTILTDLTGDLRADYIFRYRSALKIGRADAIAFTFGSSLTTKVQVLDLDGDGRQELLTERDADGYQMYTSWTLSHLTNSWETTPVTVPRSPCNVYADVNGDGLIDVVNVSNGASLRVNVGRGTLSASVNAIAAGSASLDSWPVCDRAGVDGGWRVVDIDNDGRQDLLALGGSNRPLRLLRSLGNSLRVIELPFPAPRPLTPSDTAQVLDSNGDGLADFLRIDSDTQTMHLYQRRGEHPDVVVSVTDGLGARDELIYKNLPTSGVYSPEGCDEDLYPSRCVSGAFQVVVTEKRDNGQSVVDAFRHEYSTSRADSLGEGWLGFAAHKVTDTRLPNGMTTTTRYNQTRVGSRYPFRHSPAETLTMANLAPYGYHATWVGSTFEERSTYAGATRFTSAVKTATKEFEGGIDLATFDPASAADNLVSATIVDTIVDDFGNPLVRSTNRYSGFVTEQTTIYRNDLGRWLIGLPERVTERGFAPTKEETRTHKLVYDLVTGVLDESIREPDEGARSKLYLRTKYSRDQYGLPTGIETRDRDGNIRYEAIAYDSENVHEITRTNSLNHTASRTLHPGLGLVLTSTDANSITTKFDYDGFGRLRKTINPSGLITEVVYWRDLENGSPLSERQTDNGGRVSELRRDRLGRTTVQLQKLLDGTYAQTDSAYDAVGRLSHITMPYVAGQPIYTGARLVYDGLGRIVQRHKHDPLNQTMVQFIYNGRQFSEIDEAGSHRSTVKDYAGHVVSSTIYPSNAPATTTYVYGPFDELLEAWEPGANRPSKLKYDRVGRLIETDDPDRGLRKQDFNAFSDLIEETDALNRKTTYTYDVLGRVRTRYAPHDQDGMLAEWTYDRPPGIGLLSTTTNASATRSLVYDSLARIKTTTTTIGTASYETEQTYDDIGRPKQVLYPVAPFRPRMAIESIYHPNGYLQEVREVGGRSIWKLSEMDASQRVTRETVNSTVPTHYGWNPATGLLEDVKTWVGGTLAQSARYNYYTNGNLYYREDEILGTIESFSYDAANRISTAWLGLASGPRTDWRYDARGNLISSTEPPFAGCEWSYGSGGARPHGLSSIVCSNGSTYSFSYDANGNVLSIPAIAAFSKARTVVPTPSGKPHQIIQGSYVETYGYDADGARVSKVQGANAIHIVGPELERRVVSDGYEEYTFYVSVAGRPVAQHKWRVGATSGSGDWQFLHHNLLDSVELITNDQGNAIVERLSYDVWGRRRSADWTFAAVPPISSSRYGFTNHKHDDDVSVIDMSGRVYDPLFKRFLSPDPLVQAPFYGPSWNRYSYVFNNPLRFTDPTGFEANLAQIGTGVALGMALDFVASYFSSDVIVAQMSENGTVTIGSTASAFVDWAQEKAIELDNRYHIEARAIGAGRFGSAMLAAIVLGAATGGPGALAAAPEAGAGLQQILSGRQHQPNVIEHAAGPAASEFYVKAVDSATLVVSVHSIVNAVKQLLARTSSASTVSGNSANAIKGTNQPGQVTSRGSWRKGTVDGAWDSAAPGPTGGRACPTCGTEVKVPPRSGKPRDWDINHDPAWTKREFPPEVSRKEVLDNYQKGTWLECPTCNRAAGNRR